MKKDSYQWIDPVENGVINHALVYRNMWAITSHTGKVLVYERYYIQGNQNRNIVARLSNTIRSLTPDIFPDDYEIKQHPLIILPDSPSRYV